MRRPLALIDGQADEDVAGRLLTDLGNARLFAAQHADHLRYVPAYGTWLRWGDGHWGRDETRHANRAAAATAEWLWRRALDIDDPKKRTEAAKWAGTTQGEARLRAMLTLAQADRRS